MVIEFLQFPGAHGLPSTSSRGPCPVGSGSCHPASPRVPTTPGKWNGRGSAGDLTRKLESHSGAEIQRLVINGERCALPLPFFLALTFSLSSPTKNSKHNGPSKCGPHQLPAVYLGRVCFIDMIRKVGGTWGVPVHGLSYGARSDGQLPDLMPTPLLQRLIAS